MKGYKVFDENWKCKGTDYEYQYSLGGRFKHEGEIKLCGSGFHFCEKLIDCFNYKKFNPKNKVAEIIAHGKVIRGDDKSVTDDIEIIKEISWEECLKMVNLGSGNSGLGNSGNRNSGYYNSGNRNSGHYNSGHYNSGDYNSGRYNSGHYNSGDSNLGNRNSGNRNSGYSNSGHFNSGYSNSGDSNSGHYNSGHRNSGSYNSGNRNSGHSNSGNYNSGNRNSGHSNSGNYNSGHYNSGHYNSGSYNSTNFSSGLFNTEEQKITIFDRPSDFTMDRWNKSKFAGLFNDLFSTKWIYDNEKQQKGYLKVFTYKEMWREWWKTKTNEEKELLKEIPNFDIEKFKHITGIDVSKD
jgi:hypothetical protein